MTDSKAGLSSSSTRIVRVMAGVIVSVVALSY
jgi:hypothetical protein